MKWVKQYILPLLTFLLIAAGAAMPFAVSWVQDNRISGLQEEFPLSTVNLKLQQEDGVGPVLRLCSGNCNITFEKKDRKSEGGYDRIESMEYIDLRKVGREGLKEIRRQVVRLKKLGKTGKEIEELTGVRQNRASEIWTAYQREGEASLARKKYGRKPGSHMVLTEEEQEKIRKTVAEKTPEDFGITGKLWTLGRTRQYIQKKFHKVVNERTLSDYMKRWGMSCQRPAKRARKQNPTGI